MATASPRPTGNPPARTRDGRRTLSRDQVVDAAVRLVDAEGFDALSMRRLGHTLDAGAATLYWHVKSREELLGLVVDHVFAEVLADMHDPAGWQATMRELAVALRGALLRHPGVAPILASRPAFGPNALMALEVLLAAFREAGFPPVEALLGSTTLVSFTAATARLEGQAGEWVDAPGPAAGRPGVHALLDTIGPAVFPATLEAVPAALEITATTQFDYMLDVLIEGIAARERRRATADPGATG
jgi:AcrR family transcriptional regulator